MNVVIIDNEKDNRNKIRNHIKKTLPTVNIQGEASRIKSGIQLIQKAQPDVVFLDINLKDGSAFDLLDSIKERAFMLVFMASNKQYALKSFKYDAMDYIVKPITTTNLKNTMLNLKSKYNNIESNKIFGKLKKLIPTESFYKIAIPCNDGTFFIDIEKIINIQSFQNKTKIFTDNIQIKSCKSIKYFEELLPKDQFFRTHQSHLIHINFIKYYNRFEDSITLKNDIQIPIARRRKDKLLSIIKT